MATPNPAGSSEKADPGGTNLTPMQAAALLAERRSPEASEETPTEPVQTEPTEERTVEPVEPAPEPVQDEPAPEPEAAEEDEIDYSVLLDGDDDQNEIASDDAPTSFSFSYKGKEETVSVSEAQELANLGRHYQTKVEALAGERKSFEAERQQLQQDAEALRKDREALAAQLAKFTSDVKPPDPELARTDPDEYTAQKAVYDAQMLEAEHAARELDQQRTKEQKAYQQKMKAWFDQQIARLHSRVPKMADTKEAHSVGKYLTNGVGFTADELLSGYGIQPADARFQELAWKAKKYDEARIRGKQLRSKPGKVARKGKPARDVPKTGEYEAALNEVKKTGSKQAGVKALIAQRRKNSQR